MVPMKSSSGQVTRSGSINYLLQESSLFLLFTLVFLFANTWRAYADYTLIRIGVTGLTLATVAWLVLRLTNRWPRSTTSLTFPLILFIAVYCLTAFTSIQPRRSFDEVWVFAMYVWGVAWVAQLVANGWPRELFVKSLLLGGLFLSGISLYLAFSWYKTWLTIAPGQWLPSIAYRLPLANGQATYLYLLIFGVTTRLFVTRARLPRLLLSLWLLPAALLLFLTASRGGWLAAVVGLLTIGGLLIRDRGGITYLTNLARQLWSRKPFTIVVLLIGLVVLAMMAALAVYQIQNPQKGPAALARVEYWVPAWNSFLQRPVFGWGPLTFGSTYLRYNSVPPYGFFAHAHSIFFNLLSETGIAGVLAFGVLALATYRALWHQTQTLTGEDRAVAIAAFAGAVAWATHSLVDTVQVEPMNSMLITVLLGAALGNRATAAQATDHPRNRPPLIALQTWWPIGLGLILALTGFYNIWRLTPYRAGIEQGVQGHWSEAGAQFEIATQRDPTSVIAHQQAGLVSSILAADDVPNALVTAVSEFETVVRLDPDWWLNHANLAALYLTQNNIEAALSESRIAIRLGSGAPLAQLNHGVLAEEAGLLDEARAAYIQTLNLRPNWADAYFWRANNFRATTLQQWRQSTPASPVLTLAQMEAQAQSGDSVINFTPLIAEYLRVGRLAEAGLLIQKANLAYVTTGQDRINLLWLQAELAAAQGDYASATQLGQTAVDGYLTQSAFGPGSFGQAAYGQVFFRQDTLPVDLVPQLTTAPLTDQWAIRWVQLGDWYASAGDSAAARAAYQRLLALVPDNSLAIERLK
jgi:O-antigen ligase/tetratricopeptide (TPR) repeat protein